MESWITVCIIRWAFTVKKGPIRVVRKNTNRGGSHYLLLPSPAPKTVQMQQTQQATAATFSTPTPPPSSTPEAPPKQVALAMDKLGQAERIIADIRIGADRLLEALFIAAGQPHQGNKPLQVFVKENASMQQHFKDLRSLGMRFSVSLRFD